MQKQKQRNEREKWEREMNLRSISPACWTPKDYQHGLMKEKQKEEWIWEDLTLHDEDLKIINMG